MDYKKIRKSEFSDYHPVVNIVFFALAIGITMFSNKPSFVLLTFVLSWVYSIYLKGKAAIKFNLLCIIPIIIFMVIINSIFVHNGETVLFYLGSNRVTLEAIIFGVSLAMLLSSVIVWFSCFNVILTSDKLIYLFGKITPVLGLTISMIFRFIPLFKKRYKEIKMGQKCMGRAGKAMGPFAKVRQAAKEVSILISWSLEASIETADSMEARGYGLPGRTSFNIFKFRKKDVAALIYMAIFGTLPVILCILGKTSMNYYPKIEFEDFDTLQVVSLISYCLMVLMPIVIDIKEEMKWKQLNSKI